MTKTTSLFARIAFVITLVFTAAATALRIYLMQNAYDFENGFYTNDTLHMLFRYALIAFAAIAFVTAYIYIKEEKSSKLPSENRAVVFAGIFAACAFIGFIVYNFAKFVLPMFERPGAADILMCVFSAIALLYFLTYSAKAEIGDSRALLCCGPALTLLALVFGLYFNTSVSYVNHSVVLCYATSIFLMLATIAEANAFLRRPYLRRYLAYVPTAVVLSFALAVPDIIYAITHFDAPITDIYYDIIILALGVFHLVRFTSICSAKE